MRILGIDPGTHRMGVGVVDADSGSLEPVFADALRAQRSDPLPKRLNDLYTALVGLIGEWRPSVAAIEHPFLARNVRSALAVGQAQAVAMMAAAQWGLPVVDYSPRQVKKAVTDYGGSSKAQVQEMVTVLLGLESPPRSSDAADALAVAICHANASRDLELVISE